MKKSSIHKIVILIGLIVSFFVPVFIYAQATPNNGDTTSQQPKVDGSQFQMPDPPQPKATRNELMRQVALDILQVLLTPRDKTPRQRLRGEEINLCGIQGYKGRCNIYQFTNTDFPGTSNSCAQAALATAMWAVGINNKYPSQAVLTKNVWANVPPKITLGNMVQVQGSLGTDWRELNKGLDHYSKDGIKYAWVEGIPGIKKYLDMEKPVIIMLDAGTLPQFNYKWWAGHWVTAFAYDSKYIYVSNFPENRMTWGELENAYKKGTLAIGHGTSGKACVVFK